MTTVAIEPGRTTVSAAWISIGTVATGLAILLARPAIASTVGWSVPVVAGLFATILVLALAAPAGTERRAYPASLTWQASVFAAGALVFLLGRSISSGRGPMPATAVFVSLNILAAIAEEALFRRVAYDVLLPAGPIAAIGGSALVFGLAHVTVYGWRAFPIDLAAGVVFGWQRWASGSWAVPAAIHALADLLAVM